jgi:hypothetical protein
MPVQLLWGCDPSRQFELAWLRQLLAPRLVAESALWRLEDPMPSLIPGSIPLLVESGLMRLERDPAPQRLALLDQQRRARVVALQRQGRFAVVHLSDEQGIDADGWYQLLPPTTPVWRNFSHPRLEANPQVRSFPIGPRDLFLAEQQLPGVPASRRPAPWTFMGTLWPSGSRQRAVSLFLAHLPQGLYFGGHRFGQGLALQQYRANLQASVFALAPEGDRHLDTFRLWESLCCGCIPLIVDHRATAARLLMAPHPLPVFASWAEALEFARDALADAGALDTLQSRISRWWQNYQRLIAEAMADSLSSVAAAAS